MTFSRPWGNPGRDRGGIALGEVVRGQGRAQAVNR